MIVRLSQRWYDSCMRVEPFTVGNYVHIIKRGARGMNIVNNDDDRWRFLLMLRHFNDEHISDNWFRELMDENRANTLLRASSWPKQKPVVDILAFTLLNNHFHLLLHEFKEGGVTAFMKSVCQGMSKCFNEKYGGKGSIFQGAYKSRTISDDRYLCYAGAYIQVKNTFEMYPGGLAKASTEFDMAYEWAAENPYTSLGHYAGVVDSPSIQNKKNILKESFTPLQYKKFARDFISGRADKILSGQDIEAVEFE